MAAGSLETLTHQALVAVQFAVMTGHQPQATESTVQTLQRVAGIEDLE